MARPATTDAQRLARTLSRSADLSAAVLDLQRATTPDARREAAATVAGLAGNIQRDTRILAGLGLGG